MTDTAPANGMLTAELSLYPLDQVYIPAIDAFIDALRANPGLVVSGNAMSTQIRGEHDVVMTAVSETLRASAERFGMQVLVCKFIPAALAIDP